MNYERLSNEELRKFSYPNLVAEIIESGYGMHTISDFMGHGNTYSTEVMIKAKVFGKDEILASEALGLAHYFNCEMRYMFSHELSVINGKPMAYWRWLDENKRKQEEHERSKAILEIYEELKAKPYLINFLKQCIKLNAEQREMVLEMLKEKQGAE